MLRTQNNPISALPSKDLPAIESGMAEVKQNPKANYFVYRASNFGGSYVIYRASTGKLMASYDTLPTTTYILE